MGSKARIANFTSSSTLNAGDVVIVGAGLAGLFTALKLAPMPVTVIAPAPLGKQTSSAWAQGGIAAAVSEGDRPEDHAADTIAAGAGIVDEAIAHLLARDAPNRLDDLLAYGVPFDCDFDGKLRLSREAAHGKRRIARVKGDMAGKAIMSAITKAAIETPSIQILTGLTAHQLTVDGGRVCGLEVGPAGGLAETEAIALRARAVVLATGGLGQLYALTTNPKGACGDGLSMAARVGAVIADAEFVQFHPTAMDVGRDPAPLASEALRGEGATLVNARGERFMTAIHEDAELAPRDVVARAVFSEVTSGHGAFLDCREAIGARLEDTFPNLYANALAAGIDPLRDLIPVHSAAHYHMGGVLTDDNGRTTVEGLWACGEVASTGAHGANRLASNSLLETVVFGARIAEDISGLIAMRNQYLANLTSRHTDCAAPPGRALAGRINALRQTMSAHVGVVRTRDSLETALRTASQIECASDAPLGLRNMALTASFIAAAALERQESRGSHYRTDYPQPRAQYKNRSYLSLARLETIRGLVHDISHVQHDPAHAAVTA